MRKVNKLAAAIAVAIGVGAASTANAVIELKPNGRGDALLFPVYHGYFENYFTISNMANSWIQGHLRFRGAAWTGELRDFDVILSPGDVMVFRVADLDGDGMWEIDQTLDPLNFRYTGMWANANMPFTCKDGTGAALEGCMEVSTALVPAPAGTLTQEVIEYHKQAGYVEFIGESVLDGMTHTIMNALIDSATPANNPYIKYRTRVFNKLGTTSWIWSDAEGLRGPGLWGDDQGLSDAPNALSGTGFVTNPGWSHGLAYNSETFVNFRTATCGGDSLLDGDGPDDNGNGIEDGCEIYPRGEHRIDNYRINVGDTIDGYFTPGPTPPYPSGTKRAAGANTSTPHPRETVLWFSPLAENRAVIVHDENGAVSRAGGASPLGDYVYWFDAPETSCEEEKISFNNTWGPTLADGDDYEMTDTFAGITENSRELTDAEIGLVNVNGDQWPLRWTSCPFQFLNSNPVSDPDDDFDCNWSITSLPVSAASGLSNSVAEVEEAIRAAGQTYTAYYMHDDMFDKSGLSAATLTTQFLAFFPTKYFHFEFRGGPAAPCPGNFRTMDDFVANRAGAMISYPKDVNVQVWDTQERPLGITVSNECISPATLKECFTATQGLAFHFEVNIMGIDFVKSIIAPNIAGWNSGRAVFDLLRDGVTDPYPGLGAGSKGFAGLMYAFEWDKFPPEVLAHWRSMQR